MILDSKGKFYETGWRKRSIPFLSSMRHILEPFITTYNHIQRHIGRILEKHWYVLKSDPDPRDLIPSKPNMIFRRAQTIKNLLTPSNIKKCIKKSQIATNTPKKPGSYRCHKSKCLCCNSIINNQSTFKSKSTGEVFPIKQTLSWLTQAYIPLLPFYIPNYYFYSTFIITTSIHTFPVLNTSLFTRYHVVPIYYVFYRFYFVSYILILVFIYISFFTIMVVMVKMVHNYKTTYFLLTVYIHKITAMTEKKADTFTFSEAKRLSILQQAEKVGFTWSKMKVLTDKEMWTAQKRWN